MIISLGPTREPVGPHGIRLLSTFDLGESPDNGRFGDCCREDCPFQPVCVATSGIVSVALIAVAHNANLDCPYLTVCPRLSPGTPLFAARTFLDRNQSSNRDHPFVQHIRLSTCGSLFRKRTSNSRCRRGDSNSHGLPHYDLNVARLPFRHFGLMLAVESLPEPTWGLEPQTCCLRNSCSTC